MPRIEGYLEVVKKLSSEFEEMTLIEFDGYFEKKIEPTKYVRVEVHKNKLNEKKTNQTGKWPQKNIKSKEYCNRDKQRNDFGRGWYQLT